MKRLSFAFLFYSCLLLARQPLAAENVRVAYPSMNSSTYCLIIAQKEGYMREEGLNVELLSIRASLKGINFFVSKREPAIKYMMGALRLTDRETAHAIYDIESKLILRQGFSEEKILQTIVDDMKRTTKVQREIKTGDAFDLSFVRKANEELKASGWKP